MMRRLLLLPLLLAACAVAALALDARAADAPAIPSSPDGLPVTTIELVNESRVPDEEVLRIFQAKPGEAYDGRRVARSLSLLSRQAGVRTVNVRYRPDGAGVKLRLEVVAEPLVRAISYKGFSAVDEDELTGRLKTRVDEPVYPPFLDQDREEILARYAEEGYRKASVTAEVEKVKPLRWEKVTFRVDEGEPERIVGYEEMGDSEKFSLERTLSLVDMEKGAVASPRLLRRGVEKLLETCREEDYPEARVHDARFDYGEAGAVLHLPLELGRRTRIRIDIDSDWSPPSELWDAVRGAYGEPIDREWAQRMSATLAATLQEMGYAGVEVAPEITEGKEEEPRTVRFKVMAGPRIRLREVNFVGNVRVSSKELNDRMKIWEEGFLTRPLLRRDLLLQDLVGLRGYYATLGMVEAKLTITDTEVDDSGAAVVRVEVEEGSVYRYGEIGYVVTGEGLTVEEARRLGKIESGSPADPVALDAARVHLQAELSKRGHIEASVGRQVRVDRENRTVHVNFLVEPGPLYRVGTVVAQGNARTRSDVILRELTIATGQPWNQQEVLVSQRRIFRLGFFQDVRIERAGEVDEEGQVDVVVRVREQNAGRVDYGFGYGTEEGILTFFEVGHANIGGAGRSLSLRLETQRRDRSYSLNFREPWLFNSPYDLRLALLYQNLFREAYDLDSTAFQASLDREFLRSLRASLLYTLESNRLSNVEAEAVLIAEDDKPYLLSAIGPLLVWDNRDDPFNPHRGQNHTAQAEWALPLLGSEVEYGRYTATFSVFLPWRSTTLGLLARGGFADTFGAPADLPVNKRFFLGGRATVRGFKRDEIGPKTSDGTPIGGDVMVNFKSEWRFPIYKKFGGTLFWDAGQVWLRDTDELSLSDLRQAAGGGLRYLTPVGPITLDVGYKLDRKTGETASEWNCTIGNVF
jgi:outer membrane protein insertion porin family